MKPDIAGHHRCSNLDLCSSEPRRHFDRGFIIAVVLLTALVLWSYWPTIRSLYSQWQSSDDHSVGLLVPFAACFLVWHDRKALRNCAVSPCWLIGLALLVFAQSTHIYGLLYGVRPSIERYSLILTVVSLVLMVAGWAVFRKLLWILLFLFFMVPLPAMVNNRIGVPLQNMATRGTVYALEAFSVDVVREGNILILEDNTTLGIAEACSGLRLLTAFVIVTAFLVYLMKCSRTRKFILLVSSIPIALICNIVRLCLTAAFMLLISVEVGQKFFHDFAGLFMMPVAVLLLFAELRLMDKIVTPEPAAAAGQADEHSGSNARTLPKHTKKRKAEHIIARKR